jgi:hypothetical protein
MVVELAEDSPLKAGTVLHTFGYPEPEIFGFLYVSGDRMASLGIFVPSWFDSPVRTSYRYLQHWMLHPYLWAGLKGARMRSWGAKTLQESGRRGEPHLVGDGYARIGEGSGSTNVLTNSGVDEAWTTGVLLAEGVLELLRAGRPFTKENLDAAYVKRRRASWLEQESRVAEKARDGFVPWPRGLDSLGTALTGLSGGRVEHARRGAARAQPGAHARGVLPRAHRPDGARGPAPRHGRARRGAARRADGKSRLAGHSLRWPVAGVAPRRPADGGQGAGAARIRGSRRIPRPTCCAKGAAASCASRSVLARPSRRGAPTACLASTERSACTAAPAFGAARKRERATRSGETSSSAPAPGASTRPRTEAPRRLTPVTRLDVGGDEHGKAGVGVEEAAVVTTVTAGQTANELPTASAAKRR